MVVTVQHSNKLFIAIEDKIIIYSESNGTSEIIKLPDIIVPPNLSKGQEDVLLQAYRSITSLSISKSGDYILAATQNKQIVAFDHSNRPIKNFVLNRAASKVRFTPDDDILIADKTGDAYLSLLNGDKEPTIILGHLSMLLDILVTDCNKFIITCDRDEKIRVSHYPNAYNILSFCLGHKEFVTNIEVINGDLISASGDGTIRLWNYHNGRELFCINTNDFVKDKELIAKFCNKMDQDKVDVKALPITDMQIHGNYVAVSLLDLNCIQIYSVQNSAYKHVQNITINEMLSFSFGNYLYVLCKDALEMYSLVDDVFVRNTNNNLKKFYETNKCIFDKYCNDNDVSVLYKRKFDNVQEYLERKKLRMENK